MATIQERFQQAVGMYKRGLYENAEREFDRLLEIASEDAAVCNAAGLNLAEMGKRDKAIELIEKAIRLEPDSGRYLFNLALVLNSDGKRDDAIKTYRRATKVEPDYIPAYNNLASLLRSNCQLMEAERVCRDGLEKSSESPELWNTLGNTLLSQGRAEEAVDCVRSAVELAPQTAKFHSNLLFCLHYVDNLDLNAFVEEHVKFRQAHQVPRERWYSHENDLSTRRPLRIGYMSGDFKRHSVAFFFEPIIFFHDKRRFEIICYSDVTAPDEVTRRIAAEANAFKDVCRLDDKQVADLIHDDKIDILVDLSGHTGERMLAIALKPAPIQINYLGSPVPAALDSVDYSIGDEFYDPPDKVWEGFEVPIRLEHGLHCFAPPADAPDIKTPPFETLGYMTFGCFNNHTKVNPRLLTAWAEILNSIPNSRLLFKNKSVGDEGVRHMVSEEMERHGVSRTRLEFLPFTRTLDEHLEQYNRVDIALDTFPYNGTTTTCEALWMGVPVVVWAGDRRSNLVGVSLIKHVGVDGLIGYDQKEYVETAVSLANDKERVKRLRGSLRGIMTNSEICDAPSFVRELENAYRRIWRRYVDQSK